ncbi:MAG: TonB-dependent receptor plug domain-containing protein, partial [Rhodanobacteraceae bacterium]
MNRNLLASAICASLLVAGTAYAQDTTATAQSQDQAAAQNTTASNQTQQQKKKRKEKTLKAITVTGSLIPQSQVETANPVVTITAQDIQKQGFQNVYEALRAQPLATGSVQTAVFSAGFTPQAQTVSLLGLAPHFTLILINGRPVADYPLLYNGSANFTNLSNIPVSLVDRIEILPGNQSAIYGSSAIAGVINIILKQKFEGYTLEYRAGAYTDGGGQQQRLVFTGGYNKNKLSIAYALQYENIHPVYGFNRDITSSVLSNPNPTARNPFPSTRIQQFKNGHIEYVDPNQYGGCGASSYLFGGSTSRVSRPNRGPGGKGPGYYCGSDTAVGYVTLLNPKQDAAGYVHATYQFNDNTQFFADVLYSHQKQRSYPGPNYNFFEPNFNYIFNQNTNLLTLYVKTFAPEEIGGLLRNADRTEDNQYNATFGVNGAFGGSNWNYEGYITRSDDRVADRQLRPLATNVTDFFQKKFLGPLLGTYYGYDVYAPNNAAFFQPITPADYRSFSSYIHSSNHTYTQRANVQITNTQLFNLPGGPVGFAALIEGGNQVWDNLVDPRVIAGDFYGLTGTSGQGTRDQQGAAVEFDVPIFKTLTADIAARYDHYQNVNAGSDQRPTYKLGLEYRPISTVLLRANYGTAFRAPDMAAVFQGPSGFFSNATDYYKCEKFQPTVALSNCSYNPVQYEGFQSGNPALKSVTAKSFGYGVVWSPTSKFDIKADYYHISIRNEVQQQSVNQLLKDEARCRLPNSPLGPLDPNSPTCIAALSQIVRTPVNSNPAFSQNITSIKVNKINVASETVRGIVASLDYRWSWGRYGDFALNAQYNVTLNHTFQRYPFDPTHRLLHDPQFSSEFKTIAVAALNWNVGKWSTTVQETRYGATPNYAAQVFGFG